MNEWISTRQRLPKRKDAGWSRLVVAVYRDDVGTWAAGQPEMIPFHLVRKSFYSFWMPLPDLPKEPVQ